MRKFFLIGAAVVVVAIAGAIYYAYSNLDSIAKEVMESAGSQALGVPVRVASVHIELSQGKATVTGLSVANPPGYSSQPALSFGQITVQVGSGGKVIKQIVAVNPTIRVEQKGASSNLGELQKRAQSAGGQGSKQKSAPSGDSGKHRLNIELLKVENAKAIVTSPELSAPREVVIPSLVIRNLKGTPKQIAGQVFDQLLAQVIERTATQALEQGAKKLLEKEAGGAGQAVEGLLKKLGGN
ncbi:MAG: hypothetical protein KKH47_07895 [Proteobacteria bacterium]|nr:hypothetical protein [Pseudomonadota bacterium]MBU2470408.1 hypothetical protein [Pseudomonadota bacterium]